MADPFGDAVKQLGLSAEKLEKAAEALDKMARNQWARPEPAGGGGGKSGGPRAAGGGHEAGGGRDKRNVWQRLMEEAEQGHGTRGGRRGGGRPAAGGRVPGGLPKSIGGGMGGLGGMAGGLARVAGPVGAVVGAVQALNEMRKQIQEWTTAAIESKRKLGEVSGAMASVFSHRDVRDMLRDRKMGDQLAPSTGRLAEAESRRKDATAPIEVAIEKLKADLLAKLNDMLTMGATRFTEAVNKVLEALHVDKKHWLKPFEDDGKDDLFAAITGPGGLLEMAKKIEDDAKAKLENARAAAARGPFARAAAPPRRLP